MDRPSKNEKHDIIPWKAYANTILGVWFAFGVATFSLAVYFTHLEGASLAVSILSVLIYLSIVVMCVRRLVLELSLPALMLMVPIAPLIILLLVVALLPVVQLLR